MSAFTEAVERNLKGVHFFSVGACPGCEECGLAEFDDNSQPGHDAAAAIADEGHFSWSSCDSCGSALGGQRHPAHGFVGMSMQEAVEKEREVAHFDVCVDCLMYHANGEEPETWQQSSRETERE